jgi:hypothetical protein
MTDQKAQAPGNSIRKYESLSVWSSDTSFFKNRWQVAIVPSSKIDVARLHSAFPTAKIECWKENPIRLYITPTKVENPNHLFKYSIT